MDHKTKLSELTGTTPRRSARINERHESLQKPRKRVIAELEEAAKMQCGSDLIIDLEKKIKVEPDADISVAIKQEVKDYEDPSYSDYTCAAGGTASSFLSEVVVKIEESAEVVVKEEVDIPEDDNMVDVDLQQNQTNNNCNDAASKKPSVSSNQCKYCKKEFKANRTCEHHVMRAHPEKLVKSSRRPEISKPKFRNLCKRILQDESKSLMAENSAYARLCPYCPKLIKHSSGAKVHAIEQHLDKFIQRLEMVQMDGKQMEEILQNVPRRNTKPRNLFDELERDLSKCGAEADSTSDMHWKEIMNKLCKNSANGKGPKNLTCPLCLEGGKKTIFSATQQLQFHMFNRHTEEFFISVRKPETLQQDFQKLCHSLFQDIIQEAHRSVQNRRSKKRFYAYIGDDITCPLSCCTQTFQDDGFLKVHIIKVHMDIMNEKLKRIQIESFGSIVE